MKTILESWEERAKNASLLKAGHEHHASLLTQSQQKDAADLKKYQDDRVREFLEIDDTNDSAVSEAYTRPPSVLAESQREAAIILEGAHLKAAAALKEVQEVAATFLEKMHTKFAEQHKEKDDIISWLQGSYSVKKDD